MKQEFFMNYAEGQGAPTAKYDNEEKATKEAERLAEKLGVEVTTLKAVKNIAPKDITKRVKSYEDACKVLGIEPDSIDVLTKLGFTKDEIAYRRLKTIAKALNEGWEPDWTDSSQYKYWPWFVYNSNFAGFGYAATTHSASTTATSIGSRLCYKTSTLARYAGEQFEEDYNNFLLIK